MPFPVTTTATQLSQSITQASLVSNVGTEVVYLGPDSSISVDSYELRLTPGATVNWAGGNLWAITETGVGSLGVQYGANTSVTPGPSTVSVDGGSINVLAAVQSLYDQTLLGTTLTPLLRVGQYATLHLNFEAATVAPSGNNPANYYAVELVWYASPGVLVSRDDFFVPSATKETALAFVKVPVVAAFVQIGINFVGTTAPLQTRFLGSSVASPRSYFSGGQALDGVSRGTSQDIALAGNWGGQPTLAAMTSQVFWAPSWAGSAILSINSAVPTLAGALNVSIREGWGSLNLLAALTVPFAIGVAGFQSVAVMLPSAPIRVAVTNQSTGGIGLTMGLVYQR